MANEESGASRSLYKSLSHRLLGFSRGTFGSIELLRQQIEKDLKAEANETLAIMRISLVELERYRGELDSISASDSDDSCDLLAIVERLELLFEESLRNLCIELRFNFSGKSPAFTVDVPFGVAFLSLENLLRNSVEALSGSPDEAVSVRGTISVDLEERETQCLCHVTDDGPGLDASVLGDPFSQFATTKPGGGSGLYRARELLMQHGASIGVTLPGPGGTVFTVSFPRSE